MRMTTGEGLDSFVEGMRLKLDLNEEKKGNSWTICPIEYLENKRKGEITEVESAVDDYKKAQELVDEANLCMMLFHRYMDRWIEKENNKLSEGVT